MHAAAQHDDACVGSATGPIRRIPSAADITRNNSFSGGATAAHSGHYTPYGSVFAAATSQHAAVATAAAGTHGGALGSDQHQHQQQFSHRRPPLRQHSYDTNMMQQHWKFQQQQQQQRLAHAHQAVPRHSYIQGHSLTCGCDGCAAAAQRWLLAQQQQQQLQCNSYHHHAQQQQQQQEYGLAPMFSGPPSFGAGAAAANAAFDGAHCARGNHGCWEESAAAVGVRAFSFNGPYHFHTSHSMLDGQHAHPQQQQGHAVPSVCAAQCHRQQQQQHALAIQQQQQHLMLREDGGTTHSLMPMHSAPACGYTNTGVDLSAAAPGVAPAPSAPAAGATAAALMSLHQIPSGLAAIRPRPLPTACIAHTAREHTQQRGWPGEPGAVHHAAAAEARAAAAAAAGRDMVSTHSLHLHALQQYQQQQQQQEAARGMSTDQDTEPYKQQPQLRQQELQLLLQHQLRQLVPGAGCGVPAAAAAAAATAATAAAAADAHIDLQNPAILLELLRHSGMCKVPEDGCALGWRCTWVKRLWIHMHTCRSESCASVHCRLGKQVLPHYKECSDLGCVTCARVRSYDQALEELRALTARAGSIAGESVDSQGTNDNTPSTVYIAGEDYDAAAAGRGTVAMSPALSVTSKPVSAPRGDEEVDQVMDQDTYKRQRFFPDTW